MPACVTQPQSPQPSPRSIKKRETRVRQTKTAGTGLEGFVDWTRVVDGEPVEEEEMFSLAAEFVARMCKRSTTLEGETSSSYGEKRPRRPPSDEGAHKD